VNSILNESLTSLRAHLPIFEKAQILQRWAGMIDVTPDTIPVISPVASTPGLYLASGFSGHGFGIGPGAAKLMADLTLGGLAIDVQPAQVSFEFVEADVPAAVISCEYDIRYRTSVSSLAS
jgi:glycine/D-amino acid oxidase-like deaminating enzyme